MQKVIQIKDAVLKTLNVEVRSLTINAKQMTLAVFRQLIEEPLINVETGELKGVPWGLVNYHWSECKDYGVHLHVVWQKGNELRRAREWSPASEERTVMTYARSAVTLAWAYESPPEIKDNKFVWTEKRWVKMDRVFSTVKEVLVSLDKTIEEYKREDARYPARVQEYNQRLEEHERKLKEYNCIPAAEIERLKSGSWQERLQANPPARPTAPKAIPPFNIVTEKHHPKIKELYSRFSQAAGWKEPIENGRAWDMFRLLHDREEARYALHQRNFATLETMDQLFIAV